MRSETLRYVAGLGRAGHGSRRERAGAGVQGWRFRRRPLWWFPWRWVCRPGLRRRRPGSRRLGRWRLGLESRRGLEWGLVASLRRAWVRASYGLSAWNYGYPYDYAYGYGYPYGYGYGYPGYGAPYAATTAPLVTGRSAATGQMGNYCTTPLTTWQLYHASYAGNGCSCRVSGGRSRGTVR
jgi:hypothetical protein